MTVNKIDALDMELALRRIVRFVERECGGKPRNRKSLLFQCWRIASEALPARPADGPPTPHSTNRVRDPQHERAGSLR